MDPKVWQVSKKNQERHYQIALVNQLNLVNIKTALLQDKILILNLRKIGKRTIIKTIMDKKRFTIIQEVAIEEGVEEEVVTKIKVSIKEIGIKTGVQVEIFKIGTTIEMSIKITKGRDIKVRNGKIITQIKVGALKIITIMTGILKDMITTTITEDNKKANKKLMKKMETIT